MPKIKPLDIIIFLLLISCITNIVAGSVLSISKIFFDVPVVPMASSYLFQFGVIELGIIALLFKK